MSSVFCRALFASVSLAAAAALVSPVRAADDAKPAEAAKKITYEEHVQPILRQHCYNCHSVDDAQSDLALDSFAGAMKGGASGEVVKPGDLAGSRLWALVSHTESPKMPPESDKIPEEQLNVLKAWIEGGALEHPGSKVAKKPTIKVDISASAGSKKPDGPPPMPSGLFREPFVVTPRPGAITALAASPWAPLAAVGGQKQVLLYNTDSGEFLGALPFPEGNIQVLKFGRSGLVLLAAGGRGGQSGKVVLFDVKTGKRITELGDELDEVLAADITPDLKLVAIGGPKRTVRILSVENGEVIAEMRKHTDWVYAAEFSPDGKYLATTDRSAGLIIWESATGGEYQNLVGHRSAITDVSWAPDSRNVASASEDGAVKIWDIHSGREVRNIGAHGNGVTSLEFSRDGKFLVTAGRDRTVKYWESGGRALRTFENFADQALEVAISHDGKRVIGGDWTGEVRMWEATDGKRVASLSSNPPSLAELIHRETKRLADAESALGALGGEVAAAEKAAAERATAAKAAADKHAATLAEIKRIETEQPKDKARRPQVESALKKARDEAASAKQASDKAAAAKQAADKAVADAKTDEEKTKATDAAKKAADAAKAASDKANATKAAADKAQQELAELDKAIAARDTALKAAKGREPAEKKAVETANAAKAAADKTLAEKRGAHKAKSDEVAAIKSSLERAKTEKATYDKAQVAQAK